MIRHIVALRFKAETKPETKGALYAELQGLSGQIDGILDFRAFANVSIELPLVRGFNDVFWLDFRDSSVRDTYLVDPVHQAIGGRIVAEVEGGADGVFVIDVEI
jgi:Stress responsive A/B Barrel Domain